MATFNLNQFIKKSIPCIFPCLLVISHQAKGEYFGTKGALEQNTLHMIDVSNPKLVKNTYYSYSGTYITSENTKQGGYFYSGNPYSGFHEPFSQKKNSTYIWSFWPEGSEGKDYTPFWWRPGFHGSNQVGEGASATIAGNLDDLQENIWYSHVMRSWVPSDPEAAKKIGYVGWWTKKENPRAKNQEEWKLIGIMQTPFPRPRFSGSGNGGFLEQYGHHYGVRTLRYRNAYAYYNGKWAKNDIVIPHKPGEYQRLKLSKNKEYLEHSIGKKFDGATKSEKIKNRQFTLSSPETPVLEPIKIKHLKLQRWRNQLSLQWRQIIGSSPLLQVTVTWQDTNNVNLSTSNYDIPYTSSLILDYPIDLQNKAVRLSITFHDIFYQKKSFVKTLRSRDKGLIFTSKSNPINSNSLEPGVTITYYPTTPIEAKDKISQQACRNALALRADQAKQCLLQSTQPSLDFVLQPLDQATVTQTTGFLTIEKTGLYKIHTVMSALGEMKLNGKKLLNQTFYGASTPKERLCYLEKGLHKVELTQYNDPKQHAKASVWLSTSGNQIINQKKQNWKTYKSSKTKQPINIQHSPVKDKAPNYKKVSITVNSQLQKATRVELISSRNETFWSFSPANEPIINNSYTTELILPQGKHNFQTRLFFKDKTAVTLHKPFKINIEKSPKHGWKIAKKLLKREFRPVGFGFSNDRVTILGDSTRWCYKKVKGDFEFIMQIKAFGNLAGKTTHNTHSVGCILTSSEDRPSRNTFHWNYSRYFKGRYETPATQQHGLKTKSWATSLHDLPIPGGYFKITRKGSKITLAISEDAKKWKTLITQNVPHLPTELLVGPRLVTPVAEDAKQFYYAIFDKISIKKP